MVGFEGEGATSPSGSIGSGRVSASGVFSSETSDRDRRLRTMVGSFRDTCTTKPPMKIQAPK